MPAVQLDKQIIYVTGLPRAGSTLMCQLLDQHPDVYSPGHSSPLAHTMDGMRTAWSNDPFLLSQLDVEFDLVYERLLNAYRGLFNGWFAETELGIVVDKNRGWLGMAETLAQIDPDFTMLVTIRELTQLYGSIESQHQKTQLLDSGDRTAGMTRYGRASAYFNGEGLAARCLTAIESALQDLPESVKERIIYVKYERLVEAPVEVMTEIQERLGLQPVAFDPASLVAGPSESDSHYRYKFPHNRRSAIEPPRPHWVPERIRSGLIGQYQWYYKAFYPEYLNK